MMINIKCDKHNENYISYCEDCKLNLCIFCNTHREHKRLQFMDILPKKEHLVEKLKNIKHDIKIFNNDINMIINILNEIKNKMNIYYKINEDIINNYDRKNNYETICYLNNFKNNDTINELNKTIKSNTITDKFKNIFDIYKKMNHNEINIIYKLNKDKIDLFHGNFVERYKDCCKLIIDEKEVALRGIYFNDNKKDILKIKLKGITNISNMNSIFFNCDSLMELPDISKWNTSAITDMGDIFCQSYLSSLPDISKWNTSNVNKMSGMFANLHSLTSLPDISKWDTSNVENMSCIFLNCYNLKYLPDISKWNTSNVINMDLMFHHCISLESLPDISKWNTINVVSMNSMFSKCSSIISLPDISKWNTINLKNKGSMFYQCKDSLNIPSKFKQ